MRIATVIGNRPQFVKAAAVSRILRARHEEILIHTGQHHDDELSRVFFEELGIPAPDFELKVFGGSNTSQLQRMLCELEPTLGDCRPDAVLVYGDTNSTLAGALAAAQAGLPLAHVEAGMRSFDRRMPEELNRVLADHASNICLCSTDTAVSNLEAEGIRAGVHLVGDVMADVCLAFAPIAQGRSRALERLGLREQDYLLLTAHRSENVDDSVALRRLVELVESLDQPVVFPLHPRTRDRLSRSGLLARLERVSQLQLVPPLGYLDFLRLCLSARAVLTDSGGVQKEAYLLGVQCLTLRQTTEWVETLADGWNVLVGLDPGNVRSALSQGAPAAERGDLYGAGKAAERICAVFDSYTLCK